MDASKSKKGSTAKPKFWANEFLRQLAACHAAEEIGADACWLLTIIVMAQDSPAIRFKRPVRMWNSQLMSEMGKNEKAVMAARRRAVEAGWLRYTKGNRNFAGRYEVTFPEEYQEVHSQALTVENDGQLAVEPKENVKATCSKDAVKPPDFHPVPEPVSDPDPEHTPRIPSARNAGFDDFWKVVHRKEGKHAAKNAYTQAVARVRKERGGSVQDASGYINKRMEKFAASPQAGGEVTGKIHPATWLNQGRYDDDDANWRRQPGQSGARRPCKQTSSRRGTI